MTTYHLRGGGAATDEELEAEARMFEGGKYPGQWRPVPGRPLLFDEETAAVAVRLPVSQVEALDDRAAASGSTRSEYLRALIAKDLETA